MELEWLARSVSEAGSYPSGPLFHLLQKEKPAPADLRDRHTASHRGGCRRCPGRGQPAVIGRRFHTSLVEIIAQVCCRIRAETGLTTVVLSGGVFMNVLLTSEVCVRLSKEGFETYRHRLVPPNDGRIEPGTALWLPAGDMVNIAAL